jgi:hypothetical protein
MVETQPNAARPRMKEIVQEASQALAHLDAERLEELAHSCHSLNRELRQPDARMRLFDEARASQREMALLATVLDATRANLRVLRQLSAMRADRVEYGPGPNQN